MNFMQLVVVDVPILSGSSRHDGGGKNLSNVFDGGEIGKDDRVVGEPRTAARESIDVLGAAATTGTSSLGIFSLAASMAWNMTRTSCFDNLRSRRCTDAQCVIDS